MLKYDNLLKNMRESTKYFRNKLETIKQICQKRAYL